MVRGRASASVAHHPDTVLGTTGPPACLLSELTAQLRILQQRRVAEKAAAASGAMAVSMDAMTADECCICAEILTAPESAVTKCGHVYHIHCLLRCSGMERNCIRCPICREQVHRAELVTLRNGLPKLDGPGVATAPVQAGVGDGLIDLVDDENVPDSTESRSSPSRQLRRTHARSPFADDYQSDGGVGGKSSPRSSKEDTSAKIDLELRKCLRTMNESLKDAADAYVRDRDTVLKNERREKHRLSIQKKLREQEVKEKLDEVASAKSEYNKKYQKVVRLNEIAKEKEAELNECISQANSMREALRLRQQEYERKMHDFAEKELKHSEETMACRRREKRVEQLIAWTKDNARGRSATVDRAGGGMEDRGGASRSSRRGNTTEEIVPVTVPDATAFACQWPASPPRRGNDSDDCIVEQVSREMSNRKVRASRDDVRSSSLAHSESADYAGLFGVSSLHRPSSVNRPAATNHATALRPLARPKGSAGSSMAKKGLAAFAPRRATIQKPVGAIGKASGIRRTQKWKH